MTEAEFVARVIGKPWKKNSCGFDAMDCWGLVVLYYRHVAGIDVPEASGDFYAGYVKEVGNWEKTESAKGVVFTSFHGLTPTHCGVILENGMALHARGSEEKFGNVQINSIDAIRKLYGKVEFYAHRSQ